MAELKSEMRRSIVTEFDHKSQAEFDAVVVRSVAEFHPVFSVSRQFFNSHTGSEWKQDAEQQLVDCIFGKMRHLFEEYRDTVRSHCACTTLGVPREWATMEHRLEEMLHGNDDPFPEV